MSHHAHWLDRLAVRSTRREALRTVAAAGVAGVTVPAIVRPGTTMAQGTGTECRKGCDWTSGRQFQAAGQACRQLTLTGVTQIAVAIAYVPLYLKYTGDGVVTLARQWGCWDRAVLEHKARSYDCLQPGCPGFDPKAPGGPCDGCNQNCCTCQASDDGYICCVFACGDAEHNCCPV
jgi:hypothetical protein